MGECTYLRSYFSFSTVSNSSINTSTDLHAALDNPIWNALNTTNSAMALGTNQVKYFQRDIGWFAGMQAYNDSNLTELARLLPPKTTVILFTEEKIKVPSCWQVKLERALLQMVCDNVSVDSSPDEDIKPLDDRHVPAMLALTALTKPGPFFSRTIEFGNYEGIFNNEQLVAMIGQRLQPFNYTEISAVCTDPAHTGKGYAARLLRSQLSEISRAGRQPFLHVYPENTSAISVYKKVGFTVRKEIVVYSLESVQ